MLTCNASTYCLVSVQILNHFTEFRVFSQLVYSLRHELLNIEHLGSLPEELSFELAQVEQA